MKKRVAVYARVSTFQDQKPQAQIDSMTEFCLHRGWGIIEVIIDEGYSGSSSNRPGLKRLNELVSKRKVDLVLVTKLDRLFRSLKHLTDSITFFSEKGVEFVSIGDNLDLSTSAGRLMLHILASFALQSLRKI